MLIAGVHWPAFVIRPSIEPGSSVPEQSQRSFLNFFLHSFIASLAPSATLAIKTIWSRQIVRCLVVKSLSTSQNDTNWSDTPCAFAMLLSNIIIIKRHIYCSISIKYNIQAKNWTGCRNRQCWTTCNNTPVIKVECHMHIDVSNLFNYF